MLVPAFFLASAAIAAEPPPKPCSEHLKYSEISDVDLPSDEELIPDPRAAMRPRDFVEAKLRAMGIDLSLSALQNRAPR